MGKDETFLFQSDKKITISSDLSDVFRFLSSINDEVDILMKFEDKMQRMINFNKETLRIAEELLRKSPEKSVKTNFPETPDSMKELLNFTEHPSSLGVVLFAYAETLRCLFTAYTNKVTNDTSLRSCGDKDIEIFFKEFLLSPDNEWSKNHKARSSRISPVSLQKLRNSLTHFFSVGGSKSGSKSSGITLVSKYSKHDEELEKRMKFSTQIISPEDLRDMVYGATKLLFIRWDKDCRDFHSGKKENDFKQRMQCVRDVVHKYAAILVMRDPKTGKLSRK